jgi:hypothetical protein
MLAGILSEKDVAKLAVRALTKDEQLVEILSGLHSKRDVLRSNCFKVLHYISKKDPHALYSKWDFFASLLDSDNAYHQMIAVKMLANLTLADEENKFEALFDRYYDLLNGSVIVAGHLAASSGTIAKAKPELRSKITQRLLNIDKTVQKHKDLVKAYAIDGLNEYFREAEKKSEILQFVKKQLNISSPKTRKKAKQFLKIWIQNSSKD